MNEASAKLRLVPSPGQFPDYRRQLHEAMIEGYTDRRVGGLHYKPSSHKQQLGHIAAFVAFTDGRYAWEWDVSDVDRWSASLVKAKRSRSTVRHYQGALRQFLSYLISPRLDWSERCEAQFGRPLRQLCEPENTAAHTWIFEGDPNRRPFSDEELQTFFEGLLQRMDDAKALGRKGGLTAARDYALYSTILGWGLRAREGALLLLPDIHEAPDPELKTAFGRYGVLRVRWGKALRGGSPRPRDVISMPYYQSSIDTLRWYVEEIRPRVDALDPNALFVTERGKIVNENYVSGRFGVLRDEFKLPEDLTLHCLRHTYITRLIEDGVAESFVREQVGHADAATTGIYTSVGSDFKRRIVREALDRRKKHDGV